MKKLAKIVVYFLMTGLVITGICWAQQARTPAHTMAAKDFYKGKVIDFLVGTAPGGGYDTNARLIAQYLKQYTGATVAIKNLPAGGGRYANNYVYTAKPNGLTIAIVDTPGVILGQLLGIEGVRYDYKKFIWIARVGYDKRMIQVAKDSPYHTVQDIINAKVIKVGLAGKLDQGGIGALLLAHALGLGPERVKPIPGYAGSREFTMAVAQKEADMCGNGGSSSSNFEKAGLVRTFLCLAKERSEYFPEIPTIYEKMKIPDDKGWPLATYVSMSELHRGLLMTPGVPQERVDFFRDAVSKCLSNKDLLAKAAKANITIAALSGIEVQKMFEQKVAKLSKEQINELKYLILEKYY